MIISKFLKRVTENNHSTLTYRIWNFTGSAIINLFVFTLVFIYLLPMLYLPVNSLKLQEQIADPYSPIYPADVMTYTYNNRQLLVYVVPTSDGDRRLALVKAYPNRVDFIDPENPEAGLIQWAGSRYSLAKVYIPRIHPENFLPFFTNSFYLNLILHSLIITFFGLIAVIPASIAVAYGFSRFRIPGIDFLFILLIATILIPESVTLVPTYRANISLVNWLWAYFPLESVSWLKNLNLADSQLYRIIPIVGPQFFGNAIFIFLLRQNFKSIPRDLDEAAMLDGAGPLRILVSIILPQALPVVITIALFHFFYSWNEIRQASLYLGVTRLLTPVSTVNFGDVPTLLSMAIPILVLFLAQPFFMKNMIVTGTER